MLATGLGDAGGHRTQPHGPEPDPRPEHVQDLAGQQLGRLRRVAPRQARTFPEYKLVAAGITYLHQVWTSDDWTLYRVGNPTPILAPPQAVLSYSQSRLVIRSTCACTFTVRIRYSRYLRGSAVAHGSAQTATVAADGSGYTSMTTSAPGDYSLHGSVLRLFH